MQMKTKKEEKKKKERERETVSPLSIHIVRCDVSSLDNDEARLTLPLAFRKHKSTVNEVT